LKFTLVDGLLLLEHHMQFPCLPLAVVVAGVVKMEQTQAEVVVLVV
jgi:hypothetical protein